MEIKSKEELMFLIPSLKKWANEEPDLFKKLVFENKGSEFEKFKDNLNELIKLHENPPKCLNKEEQGKLSSEKGKLLEELSKYLLMQSGIYKVKTNIRNNSNEIDLLIQLNDLGCLSASVLPIYMKEDIIVECKNYSKTVGVTWLGKLASLLCIHDVKFGILFSYYPIAGRGEWDSSKGFIKKLFLRKETAIINLCVEDLKNIANNVYTFPEIVQAKYDSLKYQTDIEAFMTKHPAME